METAGMALHSSALVRGVAAAANTITGEVWLFGQVAGVAARPGQAGTGSPWAREAPGARVLAAERSAVTAEMPVRTAAPAAPAAAAAEAARMLPLLATAERM